ncbi:MAG: hypothetical protein IJY43_01335 [Clostridia bacterium]|nr:hypothetical protein [Clostridia bacterium]
MVLESKQTTLAYRCPHCGAGVMSAVSLFNLKGSMVRLKCDCGKSAMEVLPTPDGKVRLTVPCIICPHPHHFTVSEKIFFESELFSLPCAYSDINICVMGEVNHVKAELSRTELQLLDLMEKSGITDFEALHKEAEQTVSDPQVLEIVLFVIRDLDEEGKIKCRCEDGEEREYDAEILADGVKVTCKKCGATRTIPTDSLLDAHEFLNCDHLLLE